jgi:hypothetical protein
MIPSRHHACSAYVTEWLEAFGLDGDDMCQAIDRRLTNFETIGLGADEAAEQTILTFLLKAGEPARLAA